MSKRVVVSTPALYYGGTKHFFEKNNGINVNKENYWRLQRTELFPDIEKVVERDDQIFAQDVAPSYRFSVVQGFIKTKLKHSFIRAKEWPPSSTNVNPPDYFYWDFFKTKIYKGRSWKTFVSDVELKKKIKSV